MTAYLRYALITLAFVALWWLLTGGDLSSWMVGVPTVLAAVWTTRRLGVGERWAISVSGLLRFVPLFVSDSLRGGIDVARRTLAPRLRIQPGFAVYQTALQPLDARVFFANCVCLLPGTLAADLQGKQLNVHLLDVGLDTDAELQRLERAVALVYRQRDFTLRSPDK